MTKELKKIQLPPEKQCFLHLAVCLATCSRGWAQHCGMNLCTRVVFFVCVCSRSNHRWLVGSGKRIRENEVDCMG